ncbi:MaoC family dehydratase [Lutimaribacter sp. EGI FJ00015]|uniref:MaoC family dehydratase n=1 Tax=Lutimaribacter degradans TaxID=2945989 RepID=A0ACC5ZWV2_9RHOB|nr:MaoC family dehydratase [Lutimaribacter sp. EGI FJ00013]MCM2562527.1 MaoC family dehydratase [Lutimaribacter sp. EGI FJ00013]MCO0613684.1 MaoC family dehydratase [Lutimaribacter sp. EGI FJ00015]MCO0636833.1 MaoC family dehydratase [Lutimaribacter sp. EGI FJ00014]
MTDKITLERLRAREGTHFGTSDWVEIDQKRIDAFADCTNDWQFIHIDPEQAAQTPFGGTIAHGFLTLSMLSMMSYQLPRLQGVAMGVNYGFEKVRFVSPVRAGSRIRGVFHLKSVDIQPGYVATVMDVTVEIEGQDKPALVAEWLGRRYLEEQA